MATRADFYIMQPDSTLEFVGSTSNSYYGDFETATSLKDYLKSVNELLVKNGSIPGKWYWPWKHSRITDEVFIFKITPSWLNKTKGILMTKCDVKGESNLEMPELYIVPYSVRYDERYYSEQGYYQKDKTVKISLPILSK